MRKKGSAKILSLLFFSFTFSLFLSYLLAGNSYTFSLKNYTDKTAYVKIDGRSEKEPVQPQKRRNFNVNSGDGVTVYYGERRISGVTSYGDDVCSILCCTRHAGIQLYRCGDEPACDRCN